jgi:uncharacterized repeat protein (TIGR03803 family)
MIDPKQPLILSVRQPRVLAAFAFVLVLAPMFEAQAQTFSTLYEFSTTLKGGASPSSLLLQDAKGSLYGTTYAGGDTNCMPPAGCGTLFKLTAKGKETVLFGFPDAGTDGLSPSGTFVRDAAGNSYGTTGFGGNPACTNGCGTVFRVDASGKFTLLHSFTGGRDGAYPDGLIADTAGNLYGVAVQGGGTDCTNFFLSGCGAVFKLDKTGKFSIVFRFPSGGSKGEAPIGPLARDAVGNLYGAAVWGGRGRLGVVFRIDTAGHETILHNFGSRAGGQNPLSGPILDGAGNLYGVTAYGGRKCSTIGCGVVFKLDKFGKETVLYYFTGGADGAEPLAALSRDAAGNLYGSTVYAGTYNDHCHQGCGTVVKLDATGKLTILHSFTGGTDGRWSSSALIQDAKGNLYGTTQWGGNYQHDTCSSGCGVVFKITP